jgi:copper chaperone
MIAFHVSDMSCGRCANAITKAIKEVDPTARVHVDLAALVVEIDPGKASARQLSDAILAAGYAPTAA